MKTLSNLTITMVCALFFSPGSYAAVPARLTTDVAVGFSDAYVPSGFDSNSEAFVVASGFFPNSCYQWKEALVNHPSETAHEVSAIATVREGTCLMVLMPFTKEIRLGKLSVGVHDIRLLNGDGTYIEKQIHIEE